MAQETVKNLLPKFIQYLSQKGRSPSTILAYKADLEQMIIFSNQKQKIYPESIGQEVIEAFRDSLLAEKYTPKKMMQLVFSKIFKLRYFTYPLPRVHLNITHTDVAGEGIV